MKKNIILLTILISFIGIVKAQWSQTEEPYNTGVVSLSINGNDIYSSSGNLVYYSNNNAANWTHLGSIPLMSTIYSFAFCDTNIFVGSTDGVFFSSDNGFNWVPKNNGLANLNILSLFVHDTSIFVSTYGGKTYFSNNLGDNWSLLNTGLTYPCFNCFHSVDSNIFAGSVFEGVIMSSNNGVSWNTVNTGLPQYVEITSIASIGTNIFAGTRNRGIYLSTNYGTNWVSMNNGLLDTNIISIATIGVNVFVSTNGGVFQSINNGNSWILSNNGLTGSLTKGIVANNSTVLVNKSDGVFLTTNNGVNWQLTNNGLETSHVIPLFSVGLNLFTSLGSKGITSTSDNGSSWTPINNDLLENTIHSFEFIGTDIMLTTTIYFGSYYSSNRLYYSSNSGANWSQIGTGLNNRYLDDLAYYDSICYVCTDSGLYKSDNYGINWSFLSLGGFNLWDIERRGNNLIISGEFPGLLLSTDGGVNWDTVINGIPNNIFTSLTTDGTNIYACDQSNIFVSTDNGITWEMMNTGLIASIKSILFHENYIFLTTNQGLYYSNSNGASWTEINDGLPDNIGIFGLVIHDNYLFAGTEDCGLWKRSLSDIFQQCAIQGTVNYNNGIIPTNFVTIELYKKNNNSIFSIVDTTHLNENNFQFINPTAGQYLIRARVNNPNLDPQILSTYYDSAFLWTTADTILINNSVTNIMVHLTTLPHISGFGKISGYIVYTNADPNDSIYHPVPNAVVMVLSEPDDLPVKYTLTNNYGYYEISTLPQGSYSIRVDIGGIPQMTIPIINVTATDTLFPYNNFFVDTFYTKSFGFGIWADTAGVINNINKNQVHLIVNIYPNPVKNIMIIETNSTTNYNYEIFNILGEKVCISPVENKAFIDVSRLKSGIYFLKINIEKSSIVRRFIKE